MLHQAAFCLHHFPDIFLHHFPIYLCRCGHDIYDISMDATFDKFFCDEMLYCLFYPLATVYKHFFTFFVNPVTGKSTCPVFRCVLLSSLHFSMAYYQTDSLILKLNTIVDHFD